MLKLHHWGAHAVAEASNWFAMSGQRSTKGSDDQRSSLSPGIHNPAPTPSTSPPPAPSAPGETEARGKALAGL